MVSTCQSGFTHCPQVVLVPTPNVSMVLKAHREDRALSSGVVTSSLLHHCWPGQNLLLKPLDQLLYVDLEQGYRVLKGKGHGKAQCSPEMEC